MTPQLAAGLMIIALIGILGFGCGFGLGFIVGRWKRDSRGSAVVAPILGGQDGH